MCTCPTSAALDNPSAVPALGCQLLATAGSVPEREPGLTERRANIPPSICWPSSSGILEPDRTSASAAEEDDRSVPPLFGFGSDTHRLSAAAWCLDRNSLNTGEGRREKGGVEWKGEAPRTRLSFSEWLQEGIKNCTNKKEMDFTQSLCQSLTQTQNKDDHVVRITQRDDDNE